MVRVAYSESMTLGLGMEDWEKEAGNKEKSVQAFSSPSLKFIIT
jgi:hypothetical protein